MAAKTTNIDEQLYKDMKNSSSTINQNYAIDNIQLENMEIILVENVEHIELEQMFEGIELKIFEDIQIESNIEPVNILINTYQQLINRFHQHLLEKYFLKI